MAKISGSFDAGASPSLRISVYGISDTFAREFDAILDTGSTGFLSMPIVQAFPLGLVLFGTTRITFADGSSSVRLTAWGYVSVGGESKPGVIVLHPGAQDLLLGMEFLRTFAKSLTVDAINLSFTLDDSPQSAVAAASQALAGPTGTVPESS